jgi:fucose 4-O-acetylase-like acetyltransferase
VSARDRDPWLDNTKMILVTIVVIGHMIVLLPGGEVKSRVYDLIYHVHIPAFVLITGYLSKSFRYTPRHLWSLVTMLLVPYVVFSFLMVRLRHHVGGEPLLDPWLTDPRWPMWYLIVLVMWRLATPVLRWHWLMVPVSVAVSLAAGLTNQELFDLNRALGLLPFFVIGLHLPAEGLALARRRGAWVAGLAILAGIWWLTKYTDDLWSTQFFYFRASYEELGVSPGEGMWSRLRLMLIALVGTFAVLSLVPHGRSFLTDMGRWSLVVYLCHGFVVRWLEYEGYESWMPGNGWTSACITVSLAIALALLLAWGPVATRLNYLVDPIGTFTRWRAARRVPDAAPAPR